MVSLLLFIAIFTAGASLALSAANVSFRDINELY
ncbi:MAG: ABC-type polysaccharide/polyol phosphate export permease [Minisyncoccia bacterium]|jgi:ABC-type polysaccharide/polyol phosphate export permease|tara:strand:+ start:235 stop:336 length:102 start_codon:yes stop_codon:yes gene_type:complete